MNVFVLYTLVLLFSEMLHDRPASHATTFFSKHQINMSCVNLERTKCGGTDHPTCIWDAHDYKPKCKTKDEFCHKFTQFKCEHDEAKVCKWDGKNCVGFIDGYGVHSHQGHHNQKMI